MRNNFYVTANCVLANGTSLTLTKDDFYLNGNGYVDASDSSDFPLGVAVEKTSTLILVNDDDRFTDYNFNAARITIFINDVSDDGTIDVNRVGTFVVSKKPATTEKINLTLLDHMSNADKTYTSNLIFPATAREVLMDACQTCGIMFTDTTFKNNNYTVNQKPENTTFRAVIGYVAMLAGGNARIDNNDRLRIVSFQKPIGDGSSSQNTSFKKFTSIKNLTYDTDDVIVTGVSMTEDDQTYLYGKEGYVLAIDNPLISGDIENGLALIGSEVVGLKMRPFSCSSIAYPYASFLDPIYVEDTKGREYFSYLTDIDFSFTGYTELSNNVKSAEENIKEYSVGNSVIVNQIKKEVEESMSAYDVALENLNNMAANTLGYYATLEKQPDGSFIAYQHDQPKLEDSKVIYKRGIDGFFISRDGGKTYIAGFDSEGNAVLNILYAIGIQSEWINTRGFTAKDNEGNITFRIDAETGKVEIVADSFSLRGTDIDQYIDNKIDSYSPLTVQLTNEFAGVPTDANGESGDYSECYTEVKVYMGNTNITENEDVAYTVNPSSGVIGNWNEANHRYTVTGMTTDSGSVSFSVTYSGFSMTKQFDISKTKQGTPGADGRTYFLIINPIVVSQDSEGNYTPDSISVGSYYRDGQSADRFPYTGTLVFEESTDGTSFTKTAQYNFSQYGYSIKGSNVKAIRVTVYAYNDLGTPLDVQTVTVVKEQDMQELSQEDIFNILTNNGQTQGIFLRNGKIYINASYIQSGTLSANLIKGGTLKLGGSNNTYGTLQILDSRGNVIGTWNKDGIEAENATITGVINGTSGRIGNWAFTENGITSNVKFNELTGGDSGLIEQSTRVKYQVQLLKYGVTEVNRKYIAMIIRTRAGSSTSSFLQRFSVAYDGTVTVGVPSGENIQITTDGQIQFKKGTTTRAYIDMSNSSTLRIHARNIQLDGNVIEPL